MAQNGRKPSRLSSSEIKEALDDMDLQYDIYGRAKHYYSIYKKMKYPE